VLGKLPTVADKDIGTIFKTTGMTLVSTVGGASGPLYGTAFMRAGMALADRYELTEAEVVAALEASFAECDKAYASFLPGTAFDNINFGAANRSRIGALWANASHDNEQYATLALYLRLKDITPPSSEK